MISLTSCNEHETLTIGVILGSTLEKGDIVCIDGGLGAGKTVMTRGIAHSIGIISRITSPTFTLVNEYRGEGKSLYHFDAYRLSGIEDLYDIGFEEYLTSGGIIVIEWAKVILEAIPDRHINIIINTSMEDPSIRFFEIGFSGEENKEREILLEKALKSRK